MSERSGGGQSVIWQPQGATATDGKETPLGLHAPTLGVRPPDGGRRRLQPAEGWSSLAFVSVMTLTMAWSIDDARWVLGRDPYTDFLAYAAIGAVLTGFALGKSRLPRWAALPLGATIGAIALSLLVGLTIAPPGGFVGEWFNATATSTVEAYLDLAWRNRATTTQVGHFLLLLGTIVWATALFGAWTTYRHRRPMNAVFAIGTILVVNMSITIRDQFGYLVVFSLAALLFLVRLHVLDEQREWMRHRIDDAGQTGGVYLRAGLAFVTAVVVGSLVLTGTAASAPLAGLWEGVDQRLVDIGSQITRLLPGGGPGTRVGGIVFGQTAAISGSWVTDDTPVLQVKVPDKGAYLWRAVAYNQFTGNAWSWTTTKETSIDAGSDVLADTLDGIEKAPGRRTATFSVQPFQSAPRLIVAPNQPTSVSRAIHLTTVESVAGKRFFATLSAQGGAGPYQVTSLVPDINSDDPAAGLTANKLRAAGENYPAAISEMYTDIQPGTVGPETIGLLSRIEEAARPATPYDLARALEQYFKDPANFTYDTDVTDVDCGGRNVVDCFVVSRRGYCEYYASTMAMMLRVDGVPARVVEGFLPGDRDAAGVETIRRNRSHAWVEVYFPGYGWLEFDPTGGGVGTQINLPLGPVVPLPTVNPNATPPGDGGPDDLPSRRPEGAGTAGSDGSGGPAIPIIPVAIGLPLLGLALLVLIWMRRPAGPAAPDAAYRAVVRLATRLGYGPRPTQTVYEYAGALGELLPAARPELELVARSKVEVAYGRRRLSADRLARLGEARRRLRLRLLGLLLRRPRRNRGR